MFKAGRLLVVLALAAGSFAFMASTASAVGTTDNLIENGHAEFSPAGTGAKVSVDPWLRNSALWGITGGCDNATKGSTAVRYGSPGGFPDFGSPGPFGSDRGFNFFAGGPNCGLNHSFLLQCIDVSAHFDPINLGLVTFDAGGWFGGFKNQNDRARMFIYFDPTTNCSNGNTGVFNTPYVTNVDRAGITGLLPRTTTGTVPHLTKSVLIAIRMQRAAGSYNDGYVDNAWFTLTVHEDTT
jgi:hypothetical protein